MALLMTGCPAANHTGVGLGKEGLPVVVNCGTWIRRVDVTDADTGRRVWTAHAARTAEGMDDVGSVALGSLPGRTWVEDHPLALEPRPATWRFMVEALGDDAVVVVVSDGEFEPGRVHRPGNRTLSARQFREETCSGIPISVRTLRLMLAAAAVIGVGTTLVLRSRRRRRVRHA
jgi:hypothetical protein